MVSVPAKTPVTTPLETVAFALAVLHVPPLAASLRVILAPTQTLATPLIIPAFGSGFTVIA